MNAYCALFFPHQGDTMPPFIYFMIAFLLGAITPIYLPMNSVISRHVGSPALANVVFFFIAFVATSLFAASESSLVFHRFQGVPAYLYLSGVVSAVLVLSTTILIPRLGANHFFILFVSGQVMMALIVSHLDILNSPQDSLPLRKFMGAILLLLGVSLSIWE